MFSSWQHAPNNNEDAFSQRHRVFSPKPANLATHSACIHCRSRKAKCTGESGGCERCQALGRTCSYTVRSRKKPLQGARDKAEADNTTKLHLIQSLEQSNFKCRSTSLSNGPNSGTALRNATSSLNSMDPKLQWTEKQQEQYQSGQSKIHFTSICLVPSIQGIETVAESVFNPPVQPISSDWDQLNSNSLAQWTNLPGHLPKFAQFSPGCSAAIKSPISINATDITASTGYDTTHPYRPSSPSSFYTSCCQCLHHALILVDKLELRSDKNLNTIYGGLVAHKDAVQQGTLMVNCAACRTKVENMTVLGFLVYELAQLCRRISGFILARETHTELRSGTTIGTYGLDSPLEFVTQVRGLLSFQMYHLSHLVQQLEHVALQFSSETLGGRLVACKNTLEETQKELDNVGTTLVDYSH